MLLRDFNNLQSKHLQQNAGTTDSRLTDLLNQKANLLITIDQMAAELDGLKLKIVS
jgi:hypothetical protein